LQGQPLADCDFNLAALHPAYPIKCRTSTQRTQAPESVATGRASPLDPLENSIGWDVTFATNYLGPFVLTEALIPHLPDGANVAFVASGVEDPERKPAKAAGFRGGRLISVQASARGQWMPGGSKMPGADACATSKQCLLAAAMVFARGTPRLRINAIEPGFTPNTGLGRDANAFLRFLANYLLR
jgi:NAD(P)-dependent dehydrogenase (short-subunit alcohol dehydrogenase family)